MSRDRRILPALLFFTVAGALAGHAAYYYPFFADDAFISLRYASRFIQGLGLTWTDGEPVEGYTNFLWVLINAAFGALGVDLIVSARSIGFIGALGAIIAVSVDPGDRFRLDPIRLLSGGLLLALSAPLAVWSIGGLEHGFMAGVLVGALIFLLRGLQSPKPFRRDVWISSFLFALLALLRADGIGLLCAAIVGVVVSRGITLSSIKSCVVLSVLPALFLSGQLIFRIAYYNDYLPNTAYVKVSLSWLRFEYGLEHVAQGLFAFGILYGLVVLSVILFFRSDARSRCRDRLLVPLSISALWTVYLAIVGGDIFPGWRQLLLAIAPLTLIVADSATYITSKITRYRIVAGVCWVGLLCAHLGLQMFDSDNQRAKAERWEWDGYPVATFLKRAFSHHRPLLAVDAAGALPYWSELPALDMLGLNDAHIARNPPTSFGSIAIGHDLGDGHYVWRRKPDIIVFFLPFGRREPEFLSGKQLKAKPAFDRTYQFVRVQGIGGTRAIGELYIRYKDGPLGVQRDSGTIRIPGYLFSGITPTGAHLDSANRVFTPVTASHPGRMDKLFLNAGAWQLSTDPTIPKTQVAFICGNRTASAMVGAKSYDPPVLMLRKPTTVDIIVGMEVKQTKTLRLNQVSLKRVERKRATHVCESRGVAHRVELDELRGAKPEGTNWAHPGNIVLSPSGIEVALPKTMFPRSLEMSADNNDVYEIRYWLDDIVIAQTSFGPSINRGGLAVYRASVPSTVSQKGVNMLKIRPVKGDEAYSLGHLTLIE